MNISRRGFLKGLGALGLSVILERHHGGLLVPTTVRQEAVEMAREEGIVRPQWKGTDYQREYPSYVSHYWHYHDISLIMRFFYPSLSQETVAAITRIFAACEMTTESNINYFLRMGEQLGAQETVVEAPGAWHYSWRVGIPERVRG